MARTNKSRLTQAEILTVASQQFLKEGYGKTTVRSIAAELGRSTGNLTFYYPTKEHMLAELTEMLCDFQWHMMEKEADDGLSSIMALCLELASMAAICEEDAIMKEFYLASYTTPMSLEIIRRSDARRAKEVFSQTCSGWTDAQFTEAEILVSGIEYTTLMTTGDSLPLEDRIVGALNQILSIYGVPEETRKTKIDKVLAMDFRSIGRKSHEELKEFVRKRNIDTLDELVHVSKQF